jgi:uncharacterized protein YdeI (YjbR/CyaY-like superfamily)
MTTSVETYLLDGCGRCAFGGTPQCKVNSWREEMRLLRRIILDCELTEESKWGVPCYTYKGNNVLIMSAFKEYCSISFFKGSLLQDSDQLLDKPGENSQAARLFKFTTVKEILAKEASIKAYIYEAIEVERAGLQVEFKKELDPIPEELQKKLDENAELKSAFEGLTPGRQRGYILHISQSKQSKTREARIEKCIPKILEGKGFHDR